MTILSDNLSSEIQGNISSAVEPTDDNPINDQVSDTNPTATGEGKRSQSSKRAKARLDLLLVEGGFAESRGQAQRLIMAGEVLVDEEVRTKPGQLVKRDATLRVRKQLPYVSRGGSKLAGALDDFHLDVTGLTALDVGASTGGFTDCLLQRGVDHVFAVDVGYGQLAWKLRTDSRVTVMERTNIRHLLTLPGSVVADIAVIDASFISLALVLPPTLTLLKSEGQIVALIKPQFEAGKDQVGKGGVVRKSQVHRQVLEENLQLAETLDLSILGMTISPLLGPAGNVEFLVWYKRRASPLKPVNEKIHAIDVSATIEELLKAAVELRQSKV